MEHPGDIALIGNPECSEGTTIQQQLSDLKQELHLVSEDKWRNIPEVISHARIRNQRNARLENFTYDKDD